MIDSTLFEAEDAGFLEGVLDAHLASGESRCLVAIDGERIVGVVYARPEEATDRVWDLTMIGVRAGLQGTGVGRALMGEVERELVERGQRLLLVRTSGTDRFEGTRAFYARLGYDEVARIADYWTDGDDLVVFSRVLAPTSGLRETSRSHSVASSGARSG
ncbi:GNAT family N-acetyltransferase [Agromyces aurantiacus]|uniref:GNAT family N-acetyltransferase n=2 Tax=Agromyces aurantiacus TaxID=165814 RepID=A0ABV9R8Q1_9MICO